MRLSTRCMNVLSVSLCAALAACGGGGDGAVTPQAAPTSVVDAFAGTWQGCTSDDEGTSWRGTYTITKEGDKKASYTFIKETFENETCAGNWLGKMTRGGTITWAGKTKTIDGIEVQEVDFAPTSLQMTGQFTFHGSPTAAYKQVLAVVDQKTLREGDTDAPVTSGSDGYPASLLEIKYDKK